MKLVNLLPIGLRDKLDNQLHLNQEILTPFNINPLPIILKDGAFGIMLEVNNNPLFHSFIELKNKQLITINDNKILEVEYINPYKNEFIDIAKQMLTNKTIECKISKPDDVTTIYSYNELIILTKTLDEFGDAYEHNGLLLAVDNLFKNTGNISISFTDLPIEFFVNHILNKFTNISNMSNISKFKNIDNQILELANLLERAYVQSTIPQKEELDQFATE